jgi:hypothetical protein
LLRYCAVLVETADALVGGEEEAVVEASVVGTIEGVASTIITVRVLVAVLPQGKAI